MFFRAVVIAVLMLGAAAIDSGPVMAQGSGAAEEKPQGEPGKEAPPQKVDPMVEASQALRGMAGEPECVWIGRRIVSLMFRDDLETAARHREIYERFGCPTSQIQEAFRCLARQGELDPKAPEALSSRVHACWVYPKGAPAPPAAAAPPATPEAPAAPAQP